MATSYRFDQGKNGDNIGKHWHRTTDGAVVFFNEVGFPAIHSMPFAPRTKARIAFVWRVSRISLPSQSLTRSMPVSLAATPTRDCSRICRVARNSSTGPEFEAYLERGDSIRLFPRGLRNSFADLKRNGPRPSKARAWPCRPSKSMDPSLPIGPVEVIACYRRSTVVDVGPASNRGKKFYKPQLEIVSSQT